MVYSSGGLVEASDYNTLINNINQIFGTGFGDSGYGGNSTNVSLTNLIDVISTESIDAVDWQNLRNAFADAAAHQGTVLSDALPDLSLLDVGDIVTFFSALNSATNISDLTNNRLTVAGGNTTVTIKLTDQRTTSWTTFIRHEFDVTFSSPDQARFYFNTGGQIRINASRSGGSGSSQNSSWTSLLSTNSPYNFTASEYYALTGSFAVQRQVSAGGAYANNSWTILARRIDSPGANGSNGSVIRFRSDFLDGHSNVFFDTIDGTFTSSIEEVRSTGVFVRPSPVLNTVTSLTAGS